MSIYTTRVISRHTAEGQYLQYKMDIADCKGRNKVKNFTDLELGDELDRLAHKLYELDGTFPFDNYVVGEE